MITADIQTDLDLSSLAETYGRLLPARLMREIGQAYRQYREQALWQGKQLHDLSPMTPLKPATIARKRGERDFSRRYVGNKGKVRKESIKGPSIAPDKPLIDTGNLAKNLSFQTADGLLVVGVGPMRTGAAEGHQLGTGHLPQRVHLSWNAEFVEKEIKPRVANYYEMEVRKAMKRRG